MRSDEPSLPRYRAFVVQLRGDAQLERGEVRGRVEHLVTGEQARFGSWQELERFIATTIAPAVAGGPVPERSEPTRSTDKEPKP